MTAASILLTATELNQRECFPGVAGPAAAMSDFTYIAFDAGTGQPLAHAGKAIYALQTADAVMPTAAIYILEAGAFGSWMWAEKIPLERARTLIRAAPVGIR